MYIDPKSNKPKLSLKKKRTSDFRYPNYRYPIYNTSEQPIFVNHQQYKIIKKRKARRDYLDTLMVTTGKNGYLHESRHRHAMNRARAPSGRFLTKAEMATMKKEAKNTGQSENSECYQVNRENRMVYEAKRNAGENEFVDIVQQNMNEPINGLNTNFHQNNHVAGYSQQNESKFLPSEMSEQYQNGQGNTNNIKQTYNGADVQKQQDFALSNKTNDTHEMIYNTHYNDYGYNQVNNEQANLQKYPNNNMFDTKGSPMYSNTQYAPSQYMQPRNSNQHSGKEYDQVHRKHEFEPRLIENSYDQNNIFVASQARQNTNNNLERHKSKSLVNVQTYQPLMSGYSEYEERESSHD